MLEKLMESVSKVRLTGGLVGRVCTVLVVLIVCLAALGIASRNEWVIGGTILLLVVVALPVIYKIISFAEKNPNVAILDGAEFVRAERLRQQSAKNTAVITVTAHEKAPPPLPGANHPLLGPADDAEDDDAQHGGAAHG